MRMSDWSSDVCSSDLRPPPPLPGLPKTAGEAVITALENNPDLIEARVRAKAAGYDSEVAGAGRLPTVGLFAGLDYTNFYGTLGGPLASNFTQKETHAHPGVPVNKPILQVGLPAE